MQDQIDACLAITAEVTPCERLAALFDTHYARLYGLARRLTPCADDALDLVQDTFVKAAKHSERVPEGHANEEAWLVRVLINIRRDQWRKGSVRKRHNQSLSYVRDSRQSFEAAFIARAEVWQALDSLAPRRRAALVMYELEGLAIPAIASLLGISTITVRWHLSTGRREMARSLRGFLGGPK
jgi:RNA polymerase sigma-70 factor, ECF subfamily